MNENSTENQFAISTNRFVKYFNENKLKIYSVVTFFIIAIACVTFYLNSLEKNKIYLSNEYIKAKIYVEEKKNIEATNILKEIVSSNNGTYATLSLFLIIDKKLIEDKDQLLTLFDKILKNNNFEKEIINLIIFKKALFLSDYANESELLASINPLIRGKTIWKPHALMLLGDFYANKKEYLKSKEFYTEILNIENLNKDLYEQARSQLLLISNK